MNELPLLPAEQELFDEMEQIRARHPGDDRALAGLTYLWMKDKIQYAEFKGAASVIPDRDHRVELSDAQRQEFIETLKGAGYGRRNHGRLSVESVVGGGVFVITQPYSVKNPDRVDDHWLEDLKAGIVHELIEFIDDTPAVTWTGQGGVKQRLLEWIDEEAE